MLRPVESDVDFVAWRRVRIAVMPADRCDTVEELRRDASASRLLLLAMRAGEVAGCGLADRSDTAGGGFVEPQVSPVFRRQGIGGALLRALAGHVWRLGMPAVRAGVEDPGSLAFARRFGFVEIDRQIEQTRPIGVESAPAGPPAGVEIVTLSDRPALWRACFEGFGQEVLADFALADRLQVSRAQWQTRWAGDPMFLALHDGEVIGCAGLARDPDQPSRAEHALPPSAGTGVAAASPPTSSASLCTGPP